MLMCVGGGYDVSVLVFRPTENEYPLSPRVHVYRLPKKYLFLDKTIFERNIRRLPHIRKIIKTISPDYIFAFMEGNIIVAKLASVFLRTKIIAGVRCDLEKGKGIYPRFIRDFFMKSCDMIHCQNYEQVKYFSKKVQKKCFVVPNAMRNEILEIGVNRIYKKNIENIVTVGRLTEQKNHLLLINAFAKVKEKKHDLNLTLKIYGKGELYDLLDNTINNLNMQDSIKLEGWTNDVGKVMEDADLFVLSSNYEGMPNALMEAMATGLPCISTDCPTGPSDLIENEKNGLLVPVADEDSLATAMLYMIENPEKAIEMGKCARAFIKNNYDINKICQSLMEKVSKC